MIAIAADHLFYGSIKALFHLGRDGQQPARIWLFVDQQTELVAKIQLVSCCQPRNETDRIKAHRLDMNQVAAKPISFVRQMDTDRSRIAGV